MTKGLGQRLIMTKYLAYIFALLSTVCSSWAGLESPHRIEASCATEPVAFDADDPAIWVNKASPSESLIIGTDKGGDAGDGGLYVFGIDGKLRSKITGLRRPNNVDIEYGFRFGGKEMDIAVTTERLNSCLRVYQITEAGLKEISNGGLPVFSGEKGGSSQPMGIALYKRKSDGSVFAIVSRKEGPKEGYLWQYLLEDDGKGRLKCIKVREFGAFSGIKEIEAITVDDAAGIVYYSDERAGIRAYAADPADRRGNRELAFFAVNTFKGDHEGLALYSSINRGKYLIATDQLPDNSEMHIFSCSGGKHKLLGKISGGADNTDGIEAVSVPLGDSFPKGILVAMNSKGRNFLIYDWRDVEKSIATPIESPRK